MNSIALQEKNAAVNVVGGCTVSNYEAVTAEEFAAALEELLGAGYSKYEEREIDSWHYVALRQGENALFLNYFSQLKELNAVEEEEEEIIMRDDVTERERLAEIKRRNGIE